MHNDAALRQRLFPYAYNILGSVEDSEDILQNVIIKSLQKSGIENETAYLIRAVINESINFKKRRDRIIKKDVWLPEPYATNEGEGNLESKEILQYSMLVLLERLNINERAVFLLKEAFGYTHQEISTALSMSDQNTRQLLSRAKKKLKERQFYPIHASSQHAGYLEKYITTIRQGDVKTLETMLAGEIQVLADGGADIHVVAQTTTGIAATIELLLYVYNHYQKDFEIIITQVNHQPALLFYSGTKLINCQVFETNSKGKITQIFSVIDPLKLAKIERA
ncbi:sigma-70 family RNA polymerase sigma factor [Sphingobacterium shayense]|uniref:sigma-70 family RNA polymerase sigma factor n=1 Tax=Sphingobacterium shayense TaxID=626343 RepID=UPI00155285AF|nr:sigma-70 family RNA polymerase sigma factor [Sphingobacterium shayense]NQD70076.1 sigma-70 family RNA polymerase sigma factor [Sphingobacterium shayense]